MLGIDVSKQSLTITRVDPSTRQRLLSLQVDNSQKGIHQLLQHVPPDVPWVVEPTGRYSHLVVKQGCQLGRDVRLAPTRQAKAFLRSVSPRAKTDRLDSYHLALFGLSRPLPSYPIKPEMAEQLDQLLAARKQLRAMSASLRQQKEQCAYAAASLEPVIEQAKAQIKVLDTQIAALTQNHEALAPARSLQKVPGIGPVTAAALASRLAFRTFPGPDQFVAYIGLDVSVRQSGKYQGKRKLTKQGDAELRRLLYCCAQANLRVKTSPFRAEYERAIAKGLPTTAALNVVARKIAKVCWAIAHYGTEYDPSRVGNKTKPATFTEPNP
jgi:transposase